MKDLLQTMDEEARKLKAEDAEYVRHQEQAELTATMARLQNVMAEQLQPDKDKTK